jgi:hypothetical protein
VRSKLIRKTVARAPAVEIASRMARISVITLLVTVAMAVMALDHADAAEIGVLTPDSDIGFADSDGYVPFYYDCLDNDLGAVYVPYHDGTSIIGSIVVNECAIERLGVGPNDLALLLDHEMGHARGLTHSDNPDDIMYPYLPVTGT